MALQIDNQVHPIRLDEEKKLIVIEYMPLVKFIAQRIHDRLPGHLELDDLEHAGLLGLMDAVCRYDARHSNMFKTYAEHRIRGAILDDLRKNDFMTRTGREKYKLLEQTVSCLEKEHKHEVTSDIIADALGMRMDEYFEFLNDAKVGAFLSLEEVMHKDYLKSSGEHEVLNVSEKKVWMKEINKLMFEEIDKLKKEERLVLSLYYDEELTLREIGRIMGRTESRICQIHAEVMEKLFRRLNRSINHDGGAALSTYSNLA
jgi:RNA polymerase sigma factor for flagellar operon FliA